MNVEVQIIKENGDFDASFLKDFRKKDEVKKDLCLRLNNNMYLFYKKGSNATIEDYAEIIIQNIYLILEAFACVGVYPNGFFQIIKDQKNKKLNKTTDSDEIAVMHELITQEFSRLKSIDERNILGDADDIYKQMIQFHQDNNIEYGNRDIINTKYFLENRAFESFFVTEQFLLADYFYEEVECLTTLLFNYMSFLVKVGINPKERLNEIIIEHMNKRKK